jgi:hypothetical protein
MKRKSQGQFFRKPAPPPFPQGFIYVRNLCVEIRVQSGSSKNIRVLIGLAPKGKQML